MLHSNFGQTLIRVIGGNFLCIYLYRILPLSLFPKYLSTILDVLSTERILKQSKNTSEFPRTNLGGFRQAHSSGSFSQQSSVLNAAAKSSCFYVRVIKNNKKIK